MKVMSYRLCAGGLVLGLSIAGTMPVLGQGSPSVWSSPQYQPPAGLGSPGRLSQGGTRSGSGEAVSTQRLLPLVPQDLDFGVTTEAYPSFFVYVPNLTADPRVETLEFSLVNDKGLEVYRASFAVELDRDILRNNILRIDLPAQAGLEPLAVGKDYVWLLQGFTEDLSLSDSLFAHGWVRRVLPSDELTADLAQATTVTEVAQAYIDAGVWYDAIATLESGLVDGVNGKDHDAQLHLLLQSAGIEMEGDHDE